MEGAHAAGGGDGLGIAFEVAFRIGGRDQALGRLGPDGSVDVVYLHFPDPWWKKRHKKRRVMNASFLADAQRALLRVVRHVQQLAGVLAG